MNQAVRTLKDTGITHGFAHDALRMALAAMLAVAAAGCGSSDAAPSSFGPPIHKSGDSWTITSTDTGTDPASAPVQSTEYVDSADGAGFVGRIVDGSGATTAISVNAEGELVSSGTCSFTPADNTLQYPLAADSKWNIDYTDCNGNHTTGTGAVIARETITTALGPLDTFKISLASTTTDTATPPTTQTLTDTLNWSILDGVTAKEIIQVTLGDGTQLGIDNELTSYTAAK